MSVYVREDFLTPAECDDALWRLKPVTMQSGAVILGDASRAHTGIRESRVAFVNDPALFAKVAAAMVRANDLEFHFDLSGGSEPLQLAEYRVGDYYGWHTDLGPGDASKRKLSASVQLTDPASYDGGDLELWGSEGSRARGAIVIFPSYMLHRVRRVASGARFSLVSWAIGTVPFR